MTYVLRIATDETRDLVVEALRAEADKRTRVASAASLTVARDKATGKDVRSASVKVTALLAEAANLDALATELANTEALPVVTTSAADAILEAVESGKVTVPVEPAKPLTPLEVARAAAEAALDAADDDEVEQPDEDLDADEVAEPTTTDEDLETPFVDPEAADVETGATLEDEPTEVEEVIK